MSQRKDKDQDEKDRADKVHRDTTRTSPQGKADDQDSNLRRAGVERTDGAVDEAKSAEERQAELTRNPPPLVHVDPTTGIPVSKPLESGNEPNRMTQPGNPGVRDARPNNGQVGPAQDSPARDPK